MASFLNGNRPKTANKNGKIGVILDLDLVPPDFDLAELRKGLNVDHVDFHSIVFTKKKSLPEKYYLNAFHGKRLGWNAVFEENGNEAVFVQTEYDLLLNYFTEPTPELLILSASVKAKLKVGFPLREKRLNDLELLVEPKNHRLFVSELKKYLTVMI